MMPLAQTKPAPLVRPMVPKSYVSAGILALGVLVGGIGYRYRKTDLGTMAVGAGSSIVGAGIVLLVLDLAGFDSSGAT